MTNFNYALAALGATAAGSGISGGYVAANAIDGSDVSFLRNANSSGAYLTLDLGAPQYLTELTLLHGVSNYLTSVTVYKSDDGTNWVAVTPWNLAAGLNTLPLGGITTRHFKLLKLSGTVVGTSWEVYTWQAIGPVEAPPPPTNPAADYITAWLDGIEANYVPTVEDWLDANG